MPSAALLESEFGNLTFGHLSKFAGDPTLNGWNIKFFWPVSNPAKTIFNETIKKISSSFCSIYQEAEMAERLGLLQICGGGYRKALEFLIKDYVILISTDDKPGIEAKMLQTCISEYVVDQRVKDVASRATWLGNDETHYQRRWIEKDLGDLKMLIKLVVYWIEAEQLTQEALISMPPTKK